MRVGIGSSPKRREDPRFLTGRGRYTADISRPGQVHLYVLRSPLAHAHIESVDGSAARAMPGVLAVYTAADLHRAGVEPLPCQWPLENPDGSPMADVPREVLAAERVRYVGQPVVAVIAETLAIARDAAEAIDIDYDELPCVLDLETAISDDAPRVFDEVANNLCVTCELGDKQATDSAFANAAHTVKIRHRQNRLVPCAIEPRAALGEYDPGRDEYTLHVCSQNPHLARTVYCTSALGISDNKLRVVSPDVGGGFGSKSYQYPEDVLAIWASRQVGRPVKWVCDRSDAFVSDAHARDHLTDAEAAFDAQGRLLAMRITTLANLGAGTSTFGPAVPALYYAPSLCGVYRVPAIHVDVKCLFTNTLPTDAYRGAGRPEATFTVERLIEAGAVELGIDPLVLRRRNFIPPDAFPYETPTGLVYDSGEYGRCLDAALAASDYSTFESRRERSAAAGRLRGIGVCVYTEVAGAGPTAESITYGSKMPFYEVATVRVNPDATITVLTGAHSHGQGHDTTFAQIVCERLGVPLEAVDIVHGDTHKVPFGVGTFASRSISVGGSAVLASTDKVLERGRRIAAHVLEAPVDEIDFEHGIYEVRETNRTVAFSDIAKLAYMPTFPTSETEPGLEETTWYDPPDYTFPSGAHICELEVDPDTGVTRIERYTVADDFGTVVNPMIVHGQVHGGLAQGIGQALFEQAAFDPDSGQPLTGSFLDYTLPRADDLPMFDVQTVDGHSPSNPLGAKGCGEAGTIGAPVTVINALLDALRPVGVTDISMPATPLVVWTAIRQAGGR